MSEWKLALVTNWSDFTTLPRHEHIDMLTRSDLLTVDGHGLSDLAAVECWSGLDTYPVQLHCQDCGVTETFIPDVFEDWGEGDEMFTLTGLDERMRPFIEDHAPCRWQLRLAI